MTLSRVLTAGTAAALLAVAALWVRSNASGGSEIATGPVPVTVAGTALTIPSEMIRFVLQRRGGEQARLDLALTWPGLEALPPAQPAAEATPDATPPKTIYIGIERRATDLDMGGRLGTVYVRFMLPEALPAPEGLEARRLAKGSGYDDEELYFEPGVVRPFVARCYPLAPAAPADTCLTDFNLGDRLNVSVRFPRPILAEWRSFAAAVHDLAERLLTQ